VGADAAPSGTAIARHRHHDRTPAHARLEAAGCDDDHLGTAGGAGTTTTIALLVPSATVTPEQRRSAQQQLARKVAVRVSVVVDGSGPYVQYWKAEAVADAIHRCARRHPGAAR
jgi:hypothetical protein